MNERARAGATPATERCGAGSSRGLGVGSVAGVVAPMGATAPSIVRLLCGEISPRGAAAGVGCACCGAAMGGTPPNIVR